YYYDECGVFQLNLEEFSFDLGDISIHLDGGASWLYNLVVNVFIDVIQDLFADQLDQVLAVTLRDFINDKIVNGKRLECPSADGEVMQDMRYTSVANIGTDFVSLHTSDYFYPKDEANTLDYSFRPVDAEKPDLLSSEDSQVVVDRAVFESLYAAYQTQGLIGGHIDHDTVIPSYQNMLTTNQLAAIAPELYAAYGPNQPISLAMRAGLEPQVSILPSAAYLNVTGTVDVFVGGSVPEEGEADLSLVMSYGLAGLPTTRTEQQTDFALYMFPYFQASLFNTT
ncbi:hypothetical protein KIPB_009087, partial [Kipferlia bialata]